MNRARKEALKEQIEKLDPQEHAQIFAIVKKYTDTYTKTQNGVLVSSEGLPDQCIKEMETMVNFYIDQRKRMDSDAVNRKAQNELNRIRH
jgi:hypothetical protein